MRSLLCLAAVLSAVAAVTGAADRPSIVSADAFGRDRRSGSTPRTHAAAIGPAPTPLWAFSTNWTSGLYAHPVVSDGALYVAAGSMFVLSASDGTKRFEFKAPDKGEFYSTPLIVGRAVVVGSSWGTLYAVSRDSHKVRWSVSLTGPIFGYPVLSADGARIFTAAGSTLFAVNATTGAVLWRQPLGVEGNAEFRFPILVGSLVVSASWDVRAYDSITGVVVWNTTTVAKATNVMHCGGNKVFVSGSQSALLDGETGRAYWRVEQGSLFPRCDVAAGVVVAPGPNSVLRGLSIATGAPLWAVGVSGYLKGTPAIKDGTAYVGTTGGQELAVDVRTGATAWIFNTIHGGAVWAGATIVHSILYVVSFNGYVYALPL